LKSWKTKTRQTILNNHPWLTIERHTVELPDGRLLPDWPWIITPDYVDVVAVTEEGQFLCFRQVKYAIKGTTLAIVGGFVDEGEQPLAAAQRELLEETGYESRDWVPLGSYLVDPNRGIATGHFFLARGARFVTAPVAKDLEEQELLFLTREQIESALDRGDFKVMAWAAAIAIALRLL
jgi:8-oxo-dGTP pyrophosphatase MutT (NUDIX family)